jgi:hypothetical protein
MWSSVESKLVVLRDVYVRRGRLAAEENQMPFVIEWPEDDRYPQRWWHRVAGWMKSQSYATCFVDRLSADAERKRAMLDGQSTRVIEVRK